MNDVPTDEALTHEFATDWERLRHISDEEIYAAVASAPDIIGTNEDFWKTAQVVLPQREPNITLIKPGD